jgi:hypothetical protein
MPAVRRDAEPGPMWLAVPLWLADGLWLLRSWW